MHSVDPTIQTRSLAGKGRGSRFCACFRARTTSLAGVYSCLFGADLGLTSVGLVGPGSHPSGPAGRRTAYGGESVVVRATTLATAGAGGDRAVRAGVELRLPMRATSAAGDDDRDTGPFPDALSESVAATANLGRWRSADPETIVLPDDLITYAEACELPSFDPATPITRDQLRKAPGKTVSSRARAMKPTADAAGVCRLLDADVRLPGAGLQRHDRLHLKLHLPQRLDAQVRRGVRQPSQRSKPSPGLGEVALG
jgi:hypothetical protein